MLKQGVEKWLQGREMNEIYQEGGYYHYLGMQNEGLHHELVPDRGIDVARDMELILMKHLYLF